MQAQVMGYIFKGTLWKRHKELGQQGEGSTGAAAGKAGRGDGLLQFWPELLPCTLRYLPFILSFVWGGHSRLDYVVEDAHPRQWAQIGAWLAGDRGLMLHLECQGPETNGPTYSSQGVRFPSAEC